MSRNTLLFLGALVAVVTGLLVSYFPPSQNAVAIWSMVSMFIGYGIRDLFASEKTDDPAAPPASAQLSAATNIESATPAAPQ